jgi:hypothetical protein
VQPLLADTVTNLAGAMDSLYAWVSQMGSQFDDADGTIQAVLQQGEDAFAEYQKLREALIDHQLATCAQSNPQTDVRRVAWKGDDLSQFSIAMKP